MEVTRSQGKILHSAIKHWHQENLIDEKTTQSLENDVQIMPFDWKRLAKYAFWIALACVIISISSFFANEALLQFFAFILTAPYIVKFALLLIFSGAIYCLGFIRKKKNPEKIFSNEAIFFLGVLTTAGAIYQLGAMFNTGSGHFSLLLLFSFIVYGLLGFFLKSNLIWIFSLMSLGSWMGTETGYASGWGAYYLGMNYPLRFTLFGGILTAAALMLGTTEKFSYFYRSTLVMGLLYLFISLWILSIFGDYGDMATWRHVKQIELFHWSLLFGLVSAGFIYHGLKYDNAITKGFGLTFLFINLYTRFFEYFWDEIYKTIFFAILAISFWIIGSQAEKIWRLGENK